MEESNTAIVQELLYRVFGRLGFLQNGSKIGLSLSLADALMEFKAKTLHLLTDVFKIDRHAIIAKSVQILAIKAVESKTHLLLLVTDALKILARKVLKNFIDS